MGTSLDFTKTEFEAGLLALDAMIPPKKRTLLEFAEQSIILPDGPFKGLRFSTSRQPAAAHVLNACHDLPFRRRVITGPSQSGKTLVSFCIPVMYHLFEMGETVVAGVPSLDMSGDKWREDLLPVIEASKYRDLLPKSGKGSRSGSSNLTEVKFRNGATLKFMGGGGGDKQRAGFTARVLVITETDGMDETGGTSREADKIAQLEARTRAYGERAEIYMECTVSTDTGRTWQEYTNGTESKIVVPCPHCSAWVLPERENFAGWQDAENEAEAGRSANFVCPECDGVIQDSQRPELLRQSKLVHAGQEVTPEGEIVGQIRDANTLGIRWTAFHNLFVSTVMLGSAEWKARNSTDSENAEREINQFWFAQPVKADDIDSAIEPHVLAKRTNGLERGEVPDDTLFLALGVDVGKWKLHNTLLAGTTRGAIEVVDYWIKDVASNDVGERRAIGDSLDAIDDICRQGWSGRQPDGRAYDSGYQGRGGGSNELVVYDRATAHGPEVLPSKGFGYQQKTTYTPRNQRSKTVRQIGVERWHVERIKEHRVDLLEFDADAMKTALHGHATQDPSEPGAFLLFQPEDTSDEVWRRHHWGFVRELTAERSINVTDKNGRVTKAWEKIRKNNHFLDATVLAYVTLLRLGFQPGVENHRPVAQSSRQNSQESRGFVRQMRGRR